jgi:hypothetical protein
MSDADNTFVKQQVDEAKKSIAESPQNIGCPVCKVLQHAICIGLDVGILTLDGQRELKYIILNKVNGDGNGDGKKLLSIKNGKRSINWQGFGATEICLMLLALGMVANMYFNYRVRLTLAEKNAEKEAATQVVAKTLEHNQESKQ